MLLRQRPLTISPAGGLYRAAGFSACDRPACPSAGSASPCGVRKALSRPRRGGCTSGRKGRGREERTGLEKRAGPSDGPCSLVPAWLGVGCRRPRMSRAQVRPARLPAQPYKPQGQRPVWACGSLQPGLLSPHLDSGPRSGPGEDETRRMGSSPVSRRLRGSACLCRCQAFHTHAGAPCVPGPAAPVWVLENMATHGLVFST